MTHFSEKQEIFAEINVNSKVHNGSKNLVLNAKYSHGYSHTWGGKGTAFLLRGRNGLITIRKFSPGGSGCAPRALTSWVSHFPVICLGRTVLLEKCG